MTKHWRYTLYTNIGRPMKIELVVAPGAAQAVLPPAQTKYEHHLWIQTTG